jgi:predicted DNA-binding protein YlxM (UPF0122 family)
MTTTKHDEIAAYYARGYSCSETARHFGMRRQAVQQSLARYHPEVLRAQNTRSKRPISLAPSSLRNG